MRDVHVQTQLRVSHGQDSRAGVKDSNDDCVGIRVPEEPELSTKGIAAVIADGVSSAEAGKHAAEICVQGFLNDYYDSPEAWAAKSAGHRVLRALNRWLYGLGQNFVASERGYVTTFSGLVLKSSTAYIFHVGDTRIWRLRDGQLELITRDHAIAVGPGQNQLTRALGLDMDLEIDFHSLEIAAGDRFFMSSDGLHQFIERRELGKILAEYAEKPNLACTTILDLAEERGSDDNLSCLFIGVETVGAASVDDVYDHFRRLPFPPELNVGMAIDGYAVEQELSSSSRSQVYKVRDWQTGKLLVMKTPSVNYVDDLAYIERFIMEGWVGRCVNSPYLVKSIRPKKQQNVLYNLFEYIEGPTLEAWLTAEPSRSITELVACIKQVIQGLNSLHRKEMRHQDLKPSNIVIHPERGAVIIDYGSCYVAGIAEIEVAFERDKIVGTAQFSAPEYHLGRRVTEQADLFSVAVLLYYMLTGGKYPYGEGYEKARTLRDFSTLSYTPSYKHNPHVPIWLDGAVKKALSINPQNRYEELSAFSYDLEHPSSEFTGEGFVPLAKRNPLRFWKVVAGVLFVAEVVTLYFLLT